jgi:hypothetical protein
MLGAVLARAARPLFPKREVLAAGLWLACAAATRPALGDSPEAAPPVPDPAAVAAVPAILAAQAAFEEGRALLADGQFRPACERFAESQRRYSSSVTLLNLGNCHEQGHLDGGLLAALAACEQALVEADQVFETEPRERIREEATRRAERLRARVPRVLFRPSPTAGARVRLDDVPLERLEAALPMNPGQHQVEIAATGKKTHRLVVDLAEGILLHVALPELVDVPSPLRVEPEVQPAEVRHDEAARAGAPAQRRFGQAPLWLGGAAAALGGVWLFTGLKSSESDAEYGRLLDRCAATPCTGSSLAQVEDAHERARAYAIATDYVVIPAFTVALGSALVLWWLDDFQLGRGADTAQARVRTSCSTRACSVAYAARF